MNKKKVEKYAMLYMGIGMCFGVSGGLMGIAFGMCIGLAIGTAKDKRLSEKIMEIIRIESVETIRNIIIIVKDQKGVEKQYEVSEKQMKEEKFEIGDRVVEEKEGVLISLESK